MKSGAKNSTSDVRRRRLLEENAAEIAELDVDLGRAREARELRQGLLS
jgi:hypothetical protein